MAKPFNLNNPRYRTFFVRRSICGVEFFETLLAGLSQPARSSTLIAFHISRKVLVTTAFHPESISGKQVGAAWFLSGSLGPGGAITDVPVNSTPFVVGRKANCSLCLAAPTVSGQHATISMQGEQLLITDLASTNGTYVRGEDGEVIRVHREEFQLEGKGVIGLGAAYDADATDAVRYDCAVSGA